MKVEQFANIMNSIDDRLVIRAKQRKRTGIFSPAVRVAAIAACICLLIGSFAVVHIANQTVIPEYKNALYSAEDVAGMFATYGTATNSYEEIEAPSADMLYTAEIPDSDRLPIFVYKRSDSETPPDKDGFESYLLELMPRISSSFGVDIPSYTIEKNNDPLTAGSLSVSTDLDDYLFSAYQYNRRISVSIYDGRSDSLSIPLNGKELLVDATLTDDEIIASLCDAEETLSYVFGISFDEVKISRSYRYDNVYLSVYFYDKDAHTLNQVNNRPIGDYIRLDFESQSESDREDYGDTDLSCKFIKFDKYTDLSQVYKSEALCRMISLKEAEALLYKGYVFGGHSCPICMAEQEKVDFKNYDLVGFEYIFGSGNLASVAIPFYSFYKETGKTEKGNIVYAVTYVPAIEISGYEEYFETQSKEHAKKIINDFFHGFSYKITSSCDPFPFSSASKRSRSF